MSWLRVSTVVVASLGAGCFPSLSQLSDGTGRSDGGHDAIGMQTDATGLGDVRVGAHDGTVDAHDAGADGSESQDGGSDAIADARVVTTLNGTYRIARLTSDMLALYFSTEETDGGQGSYQMVEALLLDDAGVAVSMPMKVTAGNSYGVIGDGRGSVYYSVGAGPMSGNAKIVRASLDDLADAATVVAPDGGVGLGFALGSGDVYFGNADGIRRAPTDASQPSPSTSLTSMSPSTSATFEVFAGESIYFLTSIGGLWSVPASGGSPSNAVPATSNIAPVSSGAYPATASNGTTLVWRTPALRDGGQLPHLVGGSGVAYLTANGQGFLIAPTDGGLFPLVRDVAIDGTNAYVLQGDLDCANGTGVLLQKSLTGHEAPLPLATGLFCPTHVTATNDRVYFTQVVSGEQTIYMVPRR